MSENEQADKPVDPCLFCVQWSFIIINGVLFLGGLICLCASIVMWYRGSAAEIFFGKAFQTLIIETTVMSLFFIILAFGGCLAVYKKIKWMLLWYYFTMLAILLATLASGIVAFVFRSSIESTLKRNMAISIVEYMVAPNHKIAWDYVQESLQCCGLHNYKDWKFIFILPVSCCRLDSYGNRSSCSFENFTQIFEAGCIDAIHQFIKNNFLFLGTCYLLFTFFQVINLGLATAVTLKLFNNRGAQN